MPGGDDLADAVVPLVGDVMFEDRVRVEVGAGFFPNLGLGLPARGPSALPRCGAPATARPVSREP